MGKNSKKIRILEAAAHVIQNKGIFYLTLDAVAKEAEVSKGGLLYHFPSKEALVEGMVHHLIDTYIKRIRTSASNDNIDQGKWTRAFIQETFHQNQTSKEMNASLLAAVAVNPDLLEPMRKAYREWQQHIENDGIDPVKATILRLAVDGLWLSALFDLAPLNNDYQEDIVAALLQQTEKP
ncbi:MAG: TetR/AcrR family transcriptional regulator [Clostridiales bacterium]|nr:TetR/AcrR family transcriptional regulator [Clostridiales bacterium]MCF8023183.1 TetR/AcrR family transcriptional regulator [Clostridiales bacterium]